MGSAARGVIGAAEARDRRRRVRRCGAAARARSTLSCEHPVAPSSPPAPVRVGLAGWSRTRGDRSMFPSARAGWSLTLGDRSESPSDRAGSSLIPDDRSMFPLDQARWLLIPGERSAFPSDRAGWSRGRQSPSVPVRSTGGARGYAAASGPRPGSAQCACARAIGRDGRASPAIGRQLRPFGRDGRSSAAIPRSGQVAPPRPSRLATFPPSPGGGTPIPRLLRCRTCAACRVT